MSISEARASSRGMLAAPATIGVVARNGDELPNSVVAPDEALAALGTSRENASRSADKLLAAQ